MYILTYYNRFDEIFILTIETVLNHNKTTKVMEAEIAKKTMDVIADVKWNRTGVYSSPTKTI